MANGVLTTGMLSPVEEEGQVSGVQLVVTYQVREATCSGNRWRRDLFVSMVLILVQGRLVTISVVHALLKILLLFLSPLLELTIKQQAALDST
jgi:hypothetical protein